MMKIGKYVSIMRPQYGGGLGVHWFRNEYGGRGISFSFILFYVYIHWVVKRDGSISDVEDDEQD